MPGRCYRSADKMTVHEYRGQKRGMRDRSLRFSPFEGAAVNLVVQAPRTPWYVLVRTTVCWQCKRGPKALSIAAGVAMTPWNLHPASKSFSPLFSLTSLVPQLGARCSVYTQPWATTISCFKFAGITRKTDEPLPFARLRYSSSLFIRPARVLTSILSVSIHARSPRIFLLRQVRFVIAYRGWR